MKKQLLALALLLISSAAFAADNLLVTPGAGPQSVRTKETSANIHAPAAIFVDQTGAFIGAFANFGTNPGAVLVPGVNASIIGTPAVTITSGTVTANQGTPPWTVNPGTPANWGVGGTAAAVPANAVYVGMNVGGNLVGITGTGTSLNVNCASGCTGGLAQGSTTSGQTGSLTMAAVTTGSPTYTTAQTSPLSLDTAGNLRVNVVAGGAGGGAVTVADGADVTQGAKADTTCGSAGGTCTVVQLLKFMNAAISGPLPAAASSTAPIIVGGFVPQAGTIGGCTGQVILTAANNNATQIKASTGTLCSVRWENTGTNVYSIRFYDTSTAPAAGAPCNSATNVTSNDQVQSNATSAGGVANLGPFGQAFAAGIVVCVTGALGSNSDNTNATTGLSLNLSFK